MLSKDGAFLEREAKRQIAEAQQERQSEIIAGQKAKDAETIAPDAGFDTTSTEQQLGRWLHGKEVQKRLQALNSLLIFEKCIAFPDRDNVILWTPEGRQYLFSMENGINPEFSIRESNGTRMIAQVKGWRTVLIQLIKGRYITVPAAEKAFQINQGRQSANWHKELN